MSPSSSDESLPLRQSCDRCHSHKVRCIRPNDTGDALPSDTCSRCLKAGTLCTYSPQQRPGRPSVNSEPRFSSAESSSRKRVRQTSQSANSPVMSNQNGSDSSGFASDSMPLDDMLFTSFLDRELEDTSDVAAYEQDFSSTSMSDTSMAFTSPTSAPLQFFTQTEATKKRTAPETIESLDSNGSDAAHIGISRLERDIEELADLNVRVSRCATTLMSSSRITPLSVSSPVVEDALAAMDSLVSITHHCIHDRSSRMRPIHSDAVSLAMWQDLHELDQTRRLTSTSSISSARLVADPGVVFMILACHERLLVVFESICLLIYHQLDHSRRRPLQTTRDQFPRSFESSVSNSSAGASSASNHQRRPRHSSSSSSSSRFGGGSSFLSSSSTQAVLILKLMSHLMQRADRAFVQLAAAQRGEGRATVKDIVSAQCSPASLSSRISSLPASPPLSNNSEKANGRLESSPTSKEDHMPIDSEKRDDTQSLGSTAVAKLTLNTMHRHQDRLREQMRAVSHLLKRLDPIHSSGSMNEW